MMNDPLIIYHQNFKKHISKFYPPEIEAAIKYESVQVSAEHVPFISKSNIHCLQP